MKKLSAPNRFTIPVLILSLILTSCATITQRKSYVMKVDTNDSFAKLSYIDSLYSLPTTIKVKRSKEDLPLTLVTKSSETEFTVKSSPNPAFVYGNLIGVYLCPVFYAVDFTNNKRFYYGRKVYLDTSDTVRTIVPPLEKRWTQAFSKSYWDRKYQYNAGELYLHLSAPEVNSFLLRPDGEDYKFSVGFWGIGLGIDYYYQNRRFINVSALAIMDFFIPFPAPVDLSGEYELMSSIYGSISNNHQIGRFSLGYGLSVSRNTWDLRYYRWGTEEDDPHRDPVKKSNFALGLVFPVRYYFNKNASIGFTYRPSFYRPNAVNKFQYEHVMSLDFSFAFRIKK